VIQQIGFIVLAAVVVAAATVAVCLGHITASDWLGVVGASGVGGAVGHYLTSTSVAG
jgi:hypothetical protein